MGVAHVQWNSPLKGLGKGSAHFVMTKADEVIEAESPSDTRDDSEIEVIGRAHRDELSRRLDWKPSQA